MTAQGEETTQGDEGDERANQTEDEDSGPRTVTITGVSPGPVDERAQTVTLSATSSDPALVPHPVVTGSGATRTLTFQPVADVAGIATITVEATDGHLVHGVFSRTFTVTVKSANATPTATGPS